MMDLAREHTSGLNARIRRGTALRFHHRWWGLLGIALQSAVAHAVLPDETDFPEVQLEPTQPIVDIKVV